MSDTILITIAFIIYCAVLFFLAYHAYRQTHSVSDYILGGRRLGKWVSALSAGASDMSGWLLLGLPGYAYLSGMEASWLALGLLLGTTINWTCIAPRLRLVSEQNNDSLTIPELLENIFQDESHLLSIISAFFILLFYLFYTSAGLVAAGKLFESVFQIPYSWSVIIGTAVILVYTAFGGFLAVSWTDLFQGLLMFFAMALVVVCALSEIGGWQNSLNTIEANNSQLLNLFTNNSGQLLSVISIASLLSWGLGYFGQPHILARFMAIRSVQLIPSARNIAIGWTGLCLVFAILIGLLATVLIKTPLSDISSETVLMKLLPLLFHPLIAGVVLAAILAAIMSTADSQLLVTASVLTEDVYKKFIRRQATDGHLIFIGRLAVIIMATLACWLALKPDNKVLDLVAYAWAGFGASFGPLIIYILYSRNINRHAAIAGILSGGLTVVCWKNLQGGLFDIYELLPAFIISSLCIYLGSRIKNHQRSNTGQT